MAFRRPKSELLVPWEYRTGAHESSGRPCLLPHDDGRKAFEMRKKAASS